MVGSRHLLLLGALAVTTGSQLVSAAVPDQGPGPAVVIDVRAFATLFLFQ